MDPDEERRATIARLRQMIDDHDHQSSDHHGEEPVDDGVDHDLRGGDGLTRTEGADSRGHAPSESVGFGGDAEESSQSTMVITDRGQAHEIALRRLTVRARSRSELRADLLRRRVDPDVADEVITRLAQVGLVNDAAFAAEWIRSRRQTKKLAASRLRQELRGKGVADDVISHALSDMDGCEIDMAEEFAEQRIHGMKGLDEQVIRRRLSNQLQRRGFPPGVAFRAVEAALARQHRDETDSDTPR